MGRGGFPTLLFLDAQGAKLVGPRSRSVTSFANCLQALTSIDATQTRAETGDKAAAVELLLLEVELRRVSRSDFTQRATALEKDASNEHRTALARAALDFRVGELAMRSYKGESKAVGIEVIQMLRDGAVPAAGSPTQGTFWYLARPLVQTSGDTKLIRTAAKRLRADFAEGTSYHTQASELDALADGLDKRNALAKRAKEGEAGLEAKILLIELRLSAVTLEESKTRLDAALAVATADEAVELRQRSVDLECNDLVRAFWAGTDRATIGARIVKIFGDGTPPPSKALLGLVFGPLNIHLGKEAHREDLDALLEKLRKRVDTAPYLKTLIQRLERLASKK